MFNSALAIFSAGSSFLVVGHLLFGHLLFGHFLFFWLRGGFFRFRCFRFGRFGFGRLGFGLINALYALIMVTSTLWMPLTFAYFDNPSPALWLAVRADLLLVAVGSIGLIIALFTMRPRAEGVAGVLALLGLLLFALQTAFLDPLVWPQFF